MDTELLQHTHHWWHSQRGHFFPHCFNFAELPFLFNSRQNEQIQFATFLSVPQRKNRGASGYNDFDLFYPSAILWIWTNLVRLYLRLSKAVSGFLVEYSFKSADVRQSKRTGKYFQIL